MNKEEILSMKPGREMDVKVAKEIMGHDVAKDEVMGYTEAYYDGSGKTVWGRLEAYSTNAKAANLITNKMFQEGYAGAVSWSKFGDGEYADWDGDSLL